MKKSETLAYLLEGGQSIDMAAVGMGAYIFDLVFILIITVILIKVLKTIDFDKISKEW